MAGLLRAWGCPSGGTGGWRSTCDGYLLVTGPLLGASRPEQLDDTSAAAQCKLEAELKQRLDEMTADYRNGDAPR